MKRVLYTILVATILFLPKDVFAQEEWIKENEETYYIVDGEKVTGQQVIDGENYYFDENGVQQTGFITIDDKIYFYSRTYGYTLKGWVSNFEGKWYQQDDGSLLTGIQIIDGEKYYFGEDGKLKTGFIEEDGKIYFYSRTYGHTLKGWVTNFEGTWYQQDDGSLVTGYQTIDGKHYFFGEDGKLKTGFITIDNKIYFFSRTYNYALKGWVTNFEGKWYQQDDGSLLTGPQTIDNKNYFFDENGKQQTGFIERDGKTYFYSRTYGYTLKGIISNSEGTWYELDDGEVVIAQGVQTINGKEYFFEGRNLKKGIITIDGKKYYFDSETYEKQYSNIKNKYNELVLDKSTGEIEKKQYIPVYYRQKDKRWNNKKYGLGTFGKTGCAPTSMAMAYTSILQREVLPTEVADFLYNHTDQFNRNLKGTSGMGIIHASNYFQVKWKGIGTQEELEEALKQGKVVYASMQNGKFAKPTYNHVIVMYNYNENTNMTNVLDPLTPLNNGWSDLKQIWKEQCMDPDDRTGGYAFYSLEEK